MRVIVLLLSERGTEGESSTLHYYYDWKIERGQLCLINRNYSVALAVWSRIAKSSKQLRSHLNIITERYARRSSADDESDTHLYYLHDLLVKAQVPISIFFAGPVGEISKSKISIGNPSVVQAFGICEKKTSVISTRANLSSTSTRAKRMESHPHKTYIHDPRNMPLHGRTAQQQIDLIVTIAKSPQILDHPERRLPIRHAGIHVVLLAVFVDAEAFEGEVAAGAELRLDGALVEDWGFHAQVGHAVFHDAEFERDDAGHLDGATEGDFAVALCGRQILSQGSTLRG